MFLNNSENGVLYNACTKLPPTFFGVHEDYLKMGIIKCK
jgi:hypothetical protein